MLVKHRARQPELMQLEQQFLGGLGTQIFTLAGLPLTEQNTMTGWLGFTTSANPSISRVYP